MERGTQFVIIFFRPMYIVTTFWSKNLCSKVSRFFITKVKTVLMEIKNFSDLAFRLLAV